ncbi:hypothetical protein K490DRAFT_40620 [Saccharata proteae CBS 121410]|uniref:Utp8 beta-propeller domain-containing protein n=1 Tax=Saccharata proteae CBS 121410 TaxID=1314787 RepID=A0A9P4HZG8_9PEZI|nr:hypothetical protein K490DRAFT_40620 [Saccharata proteae CBS 121410]
MSSNRDLEPSHTLASLPRPLDPVNGRTLASTICSLSSSKKRKRSEIAVAIDGEGISLYNTQTPRLVTSYALPPQTSFAAPPFSVYTKSNKQRPARRFTYATIRDTSSSSKKQVICFAEDVQRIPVGTPEKTSYNLSAESSDVVSIDVLALQSSSKKDDETHEVVVLFADGHIQSLSADLKTEKWNSTVRSSSEPSVDSIAVEYATYIDAATARRGLLKSREDVVASIDSANDERPDLLESTVLLFLVTRTEQNTRCIRLLCVRPKMTGGLTINRPSVQNLLTLDLPRASVESEEAQPTFSLHASTGLLYHLVSGSIVTYDFSSTVPRVRSELTVPGSPFQTFARISSTLLLAATANSCGIYDMKYNSAQAVIPWGTASSEEVRGKKRRQSGSSTSYLKLLSYAPESGLVLGLTEDELIGFQISSALTSSKRAKTRGGMLIHSIGKGVGHATTKMQAPEKIPYPLGVCLINATGASSEWQQARDQLDACIGNHDIRGFEELFSREVGIPLETDVDTDAMLKDTPGEAEGDDDKPMTNGAGEKDAETNGNTGEDSDAELPEWVFPETAWDVNLQTKRYKALYLLSKIFKLASPSSAVDGSVEKERMLTIDFFAPNAFQWLIWTGFLTTDLIRQAIRHISSADVPVDRITAAEVVSAVVDFDSDMHMLCNVLKGHPRLDVDFIAHAVKVLIQSLDNTPLPELKQHLLTDGAEDTTAGAEVSNQDFDKEADAAATDLSHAFSTLENGLLVRSHSLLEALTKLHTFPASTITQALRQTLTQHEIIFLIQILRIELQDGGWTSRYVDAAASSADAGDPSDRAVILIADLLGCALDSIGAGGWLSASSVNPADGSDELLHSLRLEISAALEGIHEAAFMKGLLNDFLRYGWRRKTAPQPSSKTQLKKHGKPAAIALPGQDSSERKILPLGFTVEGKVPDTKVELSGDVKQMSKRDRGQHISMRVGKYSMERIDI